VEGSVNLETLGGDLLGRRAEQRNLVACGEKSRTADIELLDTVGAAGLPEMPLLHPAMVTAPTVSAAIIADCITLSSLPTP